MNPSTADFLSWVQTHWLDDARQLRLSRYDPYPAARAAQAGTDSIINMRVAWIAGGMVASEEAQEWRRAAESYEGLYADALAKITKLTALLDEHLGTPCEQVRRENEATK